MKSQITIGALIGVAFLISSCAATPESIQPAYVSPVQYESFSCKQLGEEEERLNAAYVDVAKQQKHAHSSDATGVLLLGLPVSSMSGGNVAPEVARIKGEQQAVQKMIIAKNCRA